MNGGEPSIDFYRKRRAWRVGNRVIVAGIFLPATVGLLELYLSIKPLAWVSFFVSAGCLVSWILTQRKKRVYRLVWWPGYLAFFLAYFPAIGVTGGTTSPFFGFYIVTLYLVGVTIQNLINAKKLALIGFLSFVIWFIPPVAHIPLNYVPVPWYLSFLINGMFLVGAYLCTDAVFQTEERLGETAVNQSQELSQTRGELAHSARMAEVGNLVATIAHELAQPAQVVSAVSSLVSKLKPNDMSEKDVELFNKITLRMRDASWRIIRLSNQLRDFSRKEEFRPETLDIREAIRSVQGFSQFDMAAMKIVFDVRVPENPLWAMADSMRIQQVLLNLVNNARDACCGHQRAMILLQAMHFRDWIRVVVKNTGPGIPLDLQGRIFQTYFTTKQKGKGTGLGLTICSKLIEQHGGRILYTSEPDNTIFVIDLPKCSGPQIRVLESPAPDKNEIKERAF